jgi:hypothetical protein
MQAPALRHTVVFRLKHPRGSAAERDFLATAKQLAAIPGVERFEQLRQTSPKNAFTFGFSMEFADAAAYQRYSAHPAHVSFVNERWLPEVAEFMEIDYEPLG